ncbi:endo-1,4-beta-xylanase [Litoribacter alkaliphilus]|uniref:Beta-xylanase n=1 Tax=Litoribacter ruber TaxID=702568 RepID=A0AAP2CFV9_9BACT|nr:endo-1,4-beta-xylanase [Litoribacter alkaliphilus]MBS9522734.1 endo-1,4-beta-xylanase [Litoribacter alkaliphilus]
MNIFFFSGKALLLTVIISLLAGKHVENDGLKDAFEGNFTIGAALNHKQVKELNSQEEKILFQHFNSITAENLLKWSNMHPEPNTYRFEAADQFVALGEQMDASIIGHTLVWHQQVPDWVFEDEQGKEVGKEALLERMKDHIVNVAGRYKGRVHGWDVVNEAFFDNGEYRTSKWYEIAGKDFIKQAFQIANEVDPGMELYYNDYNMWKPEKRDAAIELAKEMRAEGIRVDGIGMQGHYGLESPSLEQIENSILAIAEAGFQVMFTEVDIDVLPNPVNRHGADIDATFDFEEKYNPYKTGLPEEVQQKLAERYKELFELFLKHEDKISRVTFWGLTDQDSWLNNWPMKGRTAYPLVFDKDGLPKENVIKKIKEVKK